VLGLCLPELTRRGAGGRSSSSGIRACVFGPTGFMGRYVINQLGRTGTQVVAPYRCTEMQVRHLRPAGDLGQITPLEFDPYEYDSIKSMMEHCNVVINLTGKRYETVHWSFQNVHCDLPEAIAMACAETGIETFIHMSALGADVDSPSEWMASKARGEAAVLAALPTATILRPAPIVGPEDFYMRFFHRLMSIMPGPLNGTMPLMDGGQNIQAPVLACDVADAVVGAINTVGTEGQTYELAGPTAYTIEELAHVYFDAVKYPKHGRPLLSVPKQVVTTMAGTKGIRFALLNQDPGMTEDQAERLTYDLVPAEGSLGFADLGVSPRKIESDLLYMQQFAAGGARGTFLETQPSD
jgi:NADH dehydrogenase (ubiquinone) 1 alpha subcomplex subunit 9